MNPTFLARHLAVLGLAFAIPGLALAADATVSRAQFTSAVENREPVNQLNHRSETDGPVRFFTEVRTDADTRIVHRWWVDDRIQQEVPLDVGAPSWRTWSQHHARGPADAWAVEVVSADGTVLHRADLPAQPAAASPPDPEPAAAPPTDETTPEPADATPAGPAPTTTPEDAESRSEPGSASDATPEPATEPEARDAPAAEDDATRNPDTSIEGAPTENGADAAPTSGDPAPPESSASSEAASSEANGENELEGLRIRLRDRAEEAEATTDDNDAAEIPAEATDTGTTNDR